MFVSDAGTEPMFAVDVLRNVPLLSELSDAELELVARTSTRRRFPKSSIVFHEGDAGDFLLVILRGRVKVVLLGDQGHETIIAILNRHQFLGEVALLDDAPRSATVIALEEVEFLQIARAPFLELVNKHPAIAIKVMTHLASALRQSHEQIRTLSMFDAYGRVVRCLLGIARDHGEADGSRVIIRPKPSNQQLARMIGCSRETVSRCVTTMQNTGYLSAIDRGLAIEPRAIRRYLDPALQNVSTLGRSGVVLPVPSPRPPTRTISRH
jgi:CRP/FNR family cyclic AMP-dependent transcriptional regulator